MEIKKTKQSIILAGQVAVEELIKVAKEPILGSSEDLSADRLKNAAATKKLAIFDAFEILSRIESEREAIESFDNGPSKTDTKQGFAERRAQ